MSKISMDEIKTKFFDLIHKQNKQMKIPSMGFSDYFIQHVTADTTHDVSKKQTEVSDEDHVQKSDQEILESIEEINFSENSDIGKYELEKLLKEEVSCDQIQDSINTLRLQQKAISKKVLQNILEQRSTCNDEFIKINDTEKQLEEALWVCKKARSYLGYAKTNLTTTSLEILAAYRKREILLELLKSLNAIKTMKSTDVELEKLLSDGNYSGAISLLIKYKNSASEYTEYKCVQSLNYKLQETLILTEYQLDTVLNEIVLNYDAKKYGKLQDAYKLLNKSLIAMDQLHINFISAIHSTVNSVLRSYNFPNDNDDKQKLLFEQLCENVSTNQYIPCLISLCKTCWIILASYYQIVMWHQNHKLFSPEIDRINESQDSLIEEKLKKGQSRIWNDIQSKICVYLSSTKLKRLKYEQFIQVLSIVHRLKKVGIEFCGESSDKLIETMQEQSEEFFNHYHILCLEEICLFLDNESWSLITSFSNILQLQEFRSVRNTLGRHKSSSNNVKIAILPAGDSSPSSNINDELVSVHSQDGGSSIYGSCGYFLRYSEKSSPFDGGLDAAMLEEDILSGIVDEGSCYFSEESDDDNKSLQSKSEEECVDNNIHIFANTTSLNVLRCIGRYLQMCKLLHCISPKIVSSMLELIALYGFAVHEIFGKDSSVQMDNLYSKNINKTLTYIEDNVIPKIKMPLNFSSLLSKELANPENLFGLVHRIIAVESGICIVNQFEQLNSYLKHVLPINEHKILESFLEHKEFMLNIPKPIYTCVISRFLDIPAILILMGKVKWDINHVSVEHSSYIDLLNRSIQTFSMRLEEISKLVQLPSVAIWNSMAHVSTHLLVEGFSNAKKCSAGGRALMQLDLTHFMSILELISGLKFPEHRVYVDSFVKAYYFPTDLFEEWIQSQKQYNNYSIKQLTNLITCICSTDKRAKQRILALLECPIE